VDKGKLVDRSIFRKQPKMKPLRKVFVSAASTAGFRRKRQPPTLAKVEFTQQEKQK
jgi:hypothetical protein